MEKQSTQFKRGGKRPGAGRPKGSLDKGNAALREIILQALHNKGGVEYIERLMESHPPAFAGLLGKVLPLTVEGTGENGALIVEITRFGSGQAPK